MRKIRYAIKRDPTTNWILGPVGACVDFLAVEIAMAGVMVRGLELMPLVPPLMKVASDEVRRKLGPQALRPFKAFLSQDMAFEGMAQRLAEDDFALPNSHTLVSLWSGIETCVEDTVVLALMNDQAAAATVAQEIKPRSQNSGLLVEPEARRAYRSLERKARQTRGVMEAYDWSLGLLDVRRIPGSDLANPMAEINSLRNCIMHSGGIVDQLAVETAPSLRMKAGDEIRLSRETLRSYFDSMSTFVQELLSGVVKSRHIRSREELETAGG